MIRYSKARTVVLALLLGAVLTGCGGDPAGTEPDVPSALTETPSELPSSSDAPTTAATETGTPTLPPGDPGTDTAAPPRPDEEEPPARSDVPRNAVLDAATLSAVVGQQWRPTTSPADSCSTPQPADTRASRTVAFVSSGGRLVETVAVHDDHEAAEEAVEVMSARLKACGWTPESAPAIGEASSQLRRKTSGGTDRVVVVGVEGVSVTLVASGPELANEEKLHAVVDIAVSSSCPAAADGCH